MNIRRARLMGLATAVLAAACAAAIDSRTYVSDVYIDGARYGAQYAVLEGKVGHHLVSQIRPSIGWLEPGPGLVGVVGIEKSAITDPEYALFGDLPPGLSFDETSGHIRGTPLRPGEWRVRPGVRDRKIGDNVYRSSGRWNTVYTQYGGKTWTVAKDPVVIRVRE